MDERDKLEGAKIQKGLEDFLEQELYGAAGNRALGQSKGGASSRKGGDLDLSLAPSGEPDLQASYEPDELDISLAEPVSRKGAYGSGVRPGAGTKESARAARVSAADRERTRVAHADGRREEGARTAHADGRREEGARTARTDRSRAKSAGNARTDGRREDGTRNVRADKRADIRESGQREMARRKNKKQEKTKKKKNRVVKVLVFIAALFVVGFFILRGVVGSVYKKMEYKEAEAFTSEPMKEDGVINVLLIGRAHV